jgi:hypothetical protein
MRLPALEIGRTRGFDRLPQDGAPLLGCAAPRVTQVDLVVTAAWAGAGSSDALVQPHDLRTRLLNARATD